MENIIEKFVKKYKEFKKVTPTEEFQIDEIPDLFCSFSNEDLKKLADKLEEIEELTSANQ